MVISIARCGGTLRENRSRGLGCPSGIERWLFVLAAGLPHCLPHRPGVGYISSQRRALPLARCGERRYRMIVNNVPSRGRRTARATLFARTGRYDHRRLRLTVVDRVLDTLVGLLLPDVVSSRFSATPPCSAAAVDWLLVGSGGAIAALLVSSSPRSIRPRRALWELVWPSGAPRMELGVSPAFVRRRTGCSSECALAIVFLALVLWLVNGTSFFIAFKAGARRSISAAFFCKALQRSASPSAPASLGIEAASKSRSAFTGSRDPRRELCAWISPSGGIPITVTGSDREDGGH